MNVIQPAPISDENMGSNVAEDEAVYSTSTTYAAGAIVRGNTPTTEHLTWESAQGSNTNHPLTDATWWIPRGATNRWKMFDQGVASQTVNADVIAATVLPPMAVDSLALLNINGVTLQVQVTDQLGAVYYDQTFNLIDPTGIDNWWAYFNVLPVRTKDVFVRDLPAFLGASVTATIDDYGNQVAVGAMIVGSNVEIGDTQYGASLSITDYSRKQQDEFGNYTVLKRAYSRRGSFTVVVPAERVDYVFNVMAELRSTPVLFIGTERYASSFIYGFYKEFSLAIEYQKYSLYNVDLEGLT